MTKITFIGAGSLEFTADLVRDILTFPLLEDAHIFLMDIDAERLDFAKQAVVRLIEAGKYPATVSASLDRAEALKGADVVLTTILTGSVEVWRHDIEIPKKYGVDINVGDTRGPSGIFRFLRTLPPMLEIVRDMEKYCPNAVLLNYTNPMAMLCGALQRQTAHSGHRSVSLGTGDCQETGGLDRSILFRMSTMSVLESTIKPGISNTKSMVVTVIRSSIKRSPKTRKYTMRSLLPMKFTWRLVIT